MKIIQPSKKRKTLAIYFDLIFFGFIWTLFAYFLFDNQLNFFSYLIVFIIVEGIALRLRYSPGYYILSIYAAPPEQANEQCQKVLIVDPYIKENESWTTMIMGALFINSGAKGIRWMSGQAILPMFGLEYGSTAMFATSTLFGVLGIIIGVMILKLRKETFVFGLIWTVVLLVGAVMSFSDFHLAIEAKARWREAHGGRAFNVEEFDGLINWMRIYIYASSVLMIVFFVWFNKRLRNQYRYV